MTDELRRENTTSTRSRHQYAATGSFTRWRSTYCGATWWQDDACTVSVSYSTTLSSMVNKLLFAKVVEAVLALESI